MSAACFHLYCTFLASNLITGSQIKLFSNQLSVAITRDRRIHHAEDVQRGAPVGQNGG